MNITESNAVSLVLRALQGDPEVDCFDVATAAVMLKARVHERLSASPDVLEGLVVANVVQIQAINAAQPETTHEILKAVNGKSTAEQRADARQARRELQKATGAKPSDNPTTAPLPKPKSSKNLDAGESSTEATAEVVPA